MASERDCEECGGWGHFVEPTNWSLTGMQKIFCRKCRGTGHKIWRCWHYRPWMGFGLWFAATMIGFYVRNHNVGAWIAASGFVAAFLVSQSMPWGPKVFQCQADGGCGHPEKKGYISSRVEIFPTGDLKNTASHNVKSSYPQE